LTKGEKQIYVVPNNSSCVFPLIVYTIGSSSWLLLLLLRIEIKWIVSCDWWDRI